MNMTPQKHTYFISLTSLYKYQARLCPMVNTPIYYNINTARHRSYFLWLVLKLQHQYRTSPFLLSVTCSQATISIPHVTVPTFCDLFLSYNTNTARHRFSFLWLVLKLQHQYRMSPFLLSVTCSQATSIPHVTVPTFCDLFSSYNTNTACHRSYFLWLVLKLQHQYRTSPFLLSVTCSQECRLSTRLNC